MSLLDMFGIKGERKKVTLVLGGGSARGMAHIGVLRVFEREKIPIDAIVGTSIGSLVGAAYSVGIPIEVMASKAYKFSWELLFDLTFPKMAIIEGKKMDDTIADVLDSKGFSDAKIPIYIVTTDIENNTKVVCSSGDLKMAIRASCSWPGIFNPVRIGDKLLVDGGVKNSVPTEIAKDICGGFIIASDVGFCVRKGKIENIIQMLGQSFQIMGEELNRYQSNLADVVIKSDLGDLDQAAFNRAREAVIEGERAATAKVEEIKRKLRM